MNKSKDYMLLVSTRSTHQYNLLVWLQLPQLDLGRTRNKFVARTFGCQGRRVITGLNTKRRCLDNILISLVNLISQEDPVDLATKNPFNTTANFLKTS